MKLSFDAECGLCPAGTSLDSDKRLIGLPSADLGAAESVSYDEDIPLLESSLGLTSAMSMHMTSFGNSGANSIRYGSYRWRPSQLLQCPSCPVGQYQPQQGSTACIACAVGKFRNASVPAWSAEPLACPSVSA